MIYIQLSSPPLKNKGTYRNLKVQVTKMMSYLCNRNKESTLRPSAPPGIIALDLCMIENKTLSSHCKNKVTDYETIHLQPRERYGSG